MPSSHKMARVLQTLFSLALVTSLLAGCSFALPAINQPTSTPESGGQDGLPTPLPQAEITFVARIPSDTPVGQGISLDILDEVTGLALNARHNLMAPVESGVYTTKITLPLGSVLKYRYSRISSPPSIEYTSTGNQVRYRMYSVSGPAQVIDQVSAWTDLRYSGATGRIQGNLIDSTNNSPIPGLLVEAGGIHTITTSDGSFLLEGLSPGKHTLFVYSMDGRFEPFQQEAIVGIDSTTPAPISLKPASMIKVTFIVRIPESPLNPLPVRLIGNIYSLGNTFADLNGGLSTVANRAPLLTALPDGNYTISINLPAGMHLQYKYSLGDGFWNAEHTMAGQFRLREIILPSEDTTIVDMVDSWQAPNSESVSFSVTVPANTPSGDYVSIQFNPFGWTEPIPMWPLGNNQWIYTLYSPLHLLGNIGYRYCRNDACGAADDQATAGFSSHGWPFTSSLIHQDFQDIVDQWAWWQPSGQPTTVVATDVQSKGTGFIAGIKLQSDFQPAWLATLGSGFQNIKDLGSNWTFLSPTFRFTRASPPVLEAVPGKDMLWQDVNAAVYIGQMRGLLVGLHAETVIEGDASEWWNSAQRDENWWANWFARYRTFAIHFADLASNTNAAALVLGDINTLPAYPGGYLPDGSPANLPVNADQLWRDIINEVRQHYHGLLIWHLPSPAGLDNVPGFLDQVDAITFSLENDLTDTNSPTQAELSNTIGSLLDNAIKPIQDQFGKPVVIEIDYPSADGSAQGCIQTAASCKAYHQLDQPILWDDAAVTLDLQEQVDLYNATMQALNLRPWVNGIISGGFFSPTVLQDKSSSIHGKPASDVIWYWYHEFLK